MHGFADSNEDRRTLKAKKIEHLVGGVQGLDLLDLGAGSGFLSTYFANQGARVTAADRDKTQFSGSCPFVEIRDHLTFSPCSFDLVIFNHVIEHVGGLDKQDEILAEIRNILRPGGRLYMAAPTKWALIEPHYKIPLLGAIPRSFADFVVKALGKGSRYDCFPLSGSTMYELASRHFPKVKEVSIEAFRWAAIHENQKLRFLPAVPSFFPTRMFIAET